MEAKFKATIVRDVHGARDYILDHIRRDRDRDRKVIYFNGWDGFGVAPVLRSMAQELVSIKANKTPSELYFDTIIYVDCSVWQSRRDMQRKIAAELKLDPKTMALFDKQDEEDDLNGVDHGSRDVIPIVWQVVTQTLLNIKFMMIFLNGSDEEVDVSGFGINPAYCNHVILWTFRKRHLTIHKRRSDIAHKLQYTHLCIDCSFIHLTSWQFLSLLREEAADTVAHQPWMQGIDLTMVTRCCLYELFLQYSFHNAIGFDWIDHAPNYWMCDGIIKGDGARKISDTVHQEIRWGRNAYWTAFEKLMEDLDDPILVAKGGISFCGSRPFRWICVTSKDLTIEEDIKAILERASSLFITLEKSDSPLGLPNGLLTHCSKLGVLILSHCSFSFVSPPFTHCHGLRFLGLDHCTHDNTTEQENKANWVCLQSLWVLDLRYTEWDGILSKEKMDVMDNLRELNIEGHMCWQLTSRLQGSLPFLQKLRIMKPTHKAEASIDCYNSFVDKTDLEILDLSGNREMENLSASLSMTKSLQMLILDGCDGLEKVVVPHELRSSLRSFSFDGYGPANHWASSFKLHVVGCSEWKQPPDVDKKHLKTSKISLKGCTQLQNLFIRGLPNLVELDLSGCPIKVLDLTTMVVNIPMLKRLFLLGCENLRAIICGSDDSPKLLKFELLCIDTRPERAHGFTQPSLAQYKNVHCFQLHAILADARLARSLFRMVRHYLFQRGNEDVYFYIHVTTSAEHTGGVQLETTSKDMIKLSTEQQPVRVRRYGDAAFSKIDDAPLLIFPQPPSQELDRHIQISHESRGLESELARSDGLGYFVGNAESLHMHDALTSDIKVWERLRWCRLERCPTLGTVFPSDAYDFDTLQIIYASDLLKADCFWRKVTGGISLFRKLQHLHLRSCPRLQFVLRAGAYFPRLETLHIIHCGDLTHVFVYEYYAVSFPKLTTIHLYNLHKLQKICEVKMVAPALETIRIRGCFGLRRLPSLQGRKPGVKRPTVELEKDVWDALEWDGLAAGHHPDLYESPVHSRYYRRRRLLRGTVLR